MYESPRITEVGSVSHLTLGSPGFGMADVLVGQLDPNGYPLQYGVAS